jgi:hypothetical protein
MFGLGPLELLIVAITAALCFTRINRIIRGPRPFPFAFATVLDDDPPPSVRSRTPATEAAVPHPKRHWSFSLWTLFVVVTTSAILAACGLKVYRWATAPNQFQYQTNDIDY